MSARAARSFAGHEGSSRCFAALAALAVAPRCRRRVSRLALPCAPSACHRRASCASRRRWPTTPRASTTRVRARRRALRLCCRPALLLGAEVHGRRALRPPLRRLWLRPRSFRRDVGEREPDDRGGGGVGGVAVDERGRVYVLDSSNARIERFSPGGRVPEPVRDVGRGARATQLGHQRRDRAARRVPLRRRPGQPPRAALPPRRRRMAGRHAAWSSARSGPAPGSSTSCRTGDRSGARPRRVRR